jgi:hypothetical protein
MSSDAEVVQEENWQILHDRITETLRPFGRKNAFREGDYWLLDDNWGWDCHQLEIQDLNLLQPRIIKALQALLADFPNWYMTVRIDVPGTEDTWPGMGLIIYKDEIVDELQREFFPEEFRHFTYEGTISWPGSKRA